MAAVSRVVQFPHAGGEHVPKGSSMGWNVGPHRRKFLALNAEIVQRDGSVDYEGLVTFWGEWEPPSNVLRRWNAVDDLPNVLHDPYWETAPADPMSQNSDPWVYGPEFYYSNCRQITYRGTSSVMQRLEAGSLILFGSTLHGSFVLDTLFVVGDDITNYDAEGTLDNVPDAFSECTLKTLAARLAYDGRGDSTLTLYRGASPGQQKNGMFSFSPSTRTDNDYVPFSRPQVIIPGVIDPKRWRSTGGAKVLRNFEEVVNVWNQVVRQVEVQGLELGTNFSVPPRR